MGSSLTYVAAKGISREELWAELKLSPLSDEEAKKTEWSHKQKIGGMLDSGWYLIVDGSEQLQRQHDLLARLSTKCDVLLGFIEEHVMVAGATCWQNGKKLWEVLHDSETSEDDLQVVGTPPAEFGAIKAQAIEQAQDNEGVDYYFEIPVALFEHITGYRYDQNYCLEDSADRQMLKSVQR